MRLGLTWFVVLFLFAAGCISAPENPTHGDAISEQAARMIALHRTSWLCQEPIQSADRDNGGARSECLVDLAFENGAAVVTTTGIPNHEFESTVGCCASEQANTWRFPLTSTTSMPENVPLRGPIAVAANGAAIYGPEDGPGGDAVASHHGQFDEDRQEVVLGICHGHSGPGGEYHYHADANCMHWHGDMAMYDWATLSSSTPSAVIGFAFDGFPIYGFFEVHEGQIIEVTSSYQLKDDETGYNGVSSYEYVEGLGTLDPCNGHDAPTPDFPEGIYHYHSTRVNGAGDLGFPYFLSCYRGEVEALNVNSDAGVAGPGGPPGGPPR